MRKIEKLIVVVLDLVVWYQVSDASQSVLTWAHIILHSDQRFYVEFLVLRIWSVFLHYLQSALQILKFLSNFKLVIDILDGGKDNFLLHKTLSNASSITFLIFLVFLLTVILIIFLIKNILLVTQVTKSEGSRLGFILSLFARFQEL